MSEQIGPRQFHESEGVEDWRVVGELVVWTDLKDQRDPCDDDATEVPTSPTGERVRCHGIMGS